MNQVVVRFQDGRILKGTTNDFLPAREVFHLVLDGTPPATKPLEIRVPELKALFFVKDFLGDPGHPASNEFDRAKLTMGRKMRVTFKDGEVVVGTTQGYQQDRPGFFLLPADAASNNERCFIVAKATQSVEMI